MSNNIWLNKLGRLCGGFNFIVRFNYKIVKNWSINNLSRIIALKGINKYLLGGI